MKKAKDSKSSSTKDDSHKSLRQRIQEIDQEALEAEIDWAQDYSQKIALARELLEQYKRPYQFHDEMGHNLHYNQSCD